MASVFVSHSWHDKPIARKLAEELRTHGVYVWLDEAEIKLGDSLIDKIREGIDEVDFVIALISPHSVESSWVQRELDIAMNQEIAGKRVKVLPILVKQCALPGFLLGKLYGNVSNAKGFRQTVTMLFNRLGIDISKSPRQVKRQAATVLSGRIIGELLNKLSGDELDAQYDALRSIKYGNGGLLHYGDDELLKNVSVLEKVASLLAPTSRTYIRLEALRVLGLAKDQNFAFQVERQLNDENEAVVVAAIRSLWGMASGSSDYKIVEKLRETSGISVRVACLDYFANAARYYSDAVAISFIEAVKSLPDQQTTDPGMKLKICRALVELWSGQTDAALARLLDEYEIAGLSLRVEILERVQAYVNEDLYLQNRSLRRRFGKLIEQAWHSEADEEKVEAWIIGLGLPTLCDRAEIWKSISTAEAAAIEAFCDAIEGKGIEVAALLDQTEDVEKLGLLLQEADPSLKAALCKVLAAMKTREALFQLATHGYNPSGWEALYVLEAVAMLDNWDDKLTSLLEYALSHRGDSARLSGLAYAQLASWRARRIGTSELLTTLQDIAQQNPATIEGDPTLARVVQKTLQGLVTSSQGTEKRRILQLLKVIGDSRY